MLKLIIEPHKLNCITIFLLILLSTVKIPATTGTPINDANSGDRSEKSWENKAAICGPGKCKDNEECVSWEKECGDGLCGLSVALEYHECFPGKGEHWTRMNPTGGKLCAENETHEIIYYEQACLANRTNPCSLHWSYKCIPKEESPHSCAVKVCPEGLACVEEIHCVIEPPCIVKATCFPCFWFAH